LLGAGLLLAGAVNMFVGRYRFLSTLESKWLFYRYLIKFNGMISYEIASSLITKSCQHAQLSSVSITRVCVYVGNARFLQIDWNQLYSAYHFWISSGSIRNDVSFDHRHQA